MAPIGRNNCSLEGKETTDAIHRGQPPGYKIGTIYKIGAEINVESGSRGANEEVPHTDPS